jgi:Protein of unknown function (DUF4013)
MPRSLLASPRLSHGERACDVSDPTVEKLWRNLTKAIDPEHRDQGFGFLHHGSMPMLISEDGRWWWDGTRWRSRSVQGRLDLFWFTSTPEWTTRVIVTGLIGLIPIVGAINMLGWVLTATDMVRRGWKELPPAGFQHLERGVAPFVVGLIYGVVLAIVMVVLLVITVLLAASGSTHLVVAIGLGLLILLLLIAWWLASLYLFAAVLIGSDQLGIAKAIDPARLFALARANHDVSLHIALLYAAATIAVGAISGSVSFFFPLAIFLASLVLPAIYAILVPSLAAFRVEAPADPKPA